MNGKVKDGDKCVISTCYISKQKTNNIFMKQSDPSSYSLENISLISF